MRDPDKFDFERPQPDALARTDYVQRRVLEHFVLVETPLHQLQRELGTVDGNVQLRQQERHAADVIFMAVRQNEPAHHGGMLLQIGEIGSDDIHAEQLGIREHHAGVDHDDVVAVAQRHRIHAEFAETAERDNFEFLIGHRRS